MLLARVLGDTHPNVIGIGAGMFKLGLTGGIGSGKSTVSKLLAQWGATVIDADQLARQLTEPGGLGIKPVSEAFGADVIDANGAMDRQRMREIVFTDNAARTRLEQILHPLIGSAADRAAELATGCYIVFEIPLLVESGRWRNKVDRVCVVDCDVDTQISRVQARSGLSVSAIQGILAAQATREDRLLVADDVILNDISVPIDYLTEQTSALHKIWCALADRSSSFGS